MTHPKKSLLALSLAAGLLGCVGDPDLGADETSDAAAALDADVDVALDTRIVRDRWETAEPGCEDVIESLSPDHRLTLVGCEGEPLLGALVDRAGRIECVDAMTLLLQETTAHRATPTSTDPSPQPSHPGSPDADVAAFFVADGTRVDPTPTPVTEATRADPTPTPVTQPDREDPTPTPVMQD